MIKFTKGNLSISIDGFLYIKNKDHKESYYSLDCEKSIAKQKFVCWSVCLFVEVKGTAKSDCWWRCALGVPWTARRTRGNSVLLLFKVQNYEAVSRSTKEYYRSTLFLPWGWASSAQTVWSSPYRGELTMMYSHVQKFVSYHCWSIP